MKSPIQQKFKSKLGEVRCYKREIFKPPKTSARDKTIILKNQSELNLTRVDNITKFEHPFYELITQKLPIRTHNIA